MNSCKVCFKPDAECICPECPNCELVGNPDCYKDHSLRLNREQLIIREHKRLEDATSKCFEHEQKIQTLLMADEDYCEEWSNV